MDISTSDMVKMNVEESSRGTDEFVKEIQFSDLFDLEDIQHVQDMFSDATGVASIITRPDGTPITRPSNFCRLCNNVIRKTDKGLLNCFKSDAVIGRKNPSGPVIQPCLSGGLWDAGASITVGGKHVANWLIGQVKNEEQDEQKMLLYADEIGVDRAEFMSALAEVPVMSKAQFSKVAGMLFAFASELSSKAFLHKQMEQVLIRQKQVENALRDSEQHYRLIVEQSPNTVIIHCEGKIVYINTAGKALLGAKSDDEILGKPAIDFVHPDDRAVVIQKISKSFTEWKTTPLTEEKFLLPDGRIIHVDVIGIPITYKGKPAMEVIIRDITDRKRAGQLIRDSEYRYRNFITNASEGIYRIDFTEPVPVHLDDQELIERLTRFAIVGEANDALARMYGLKPSDMIGKMAADFAPEYGKRAILAVRAPEHQVKEVETLDVDKNGKPLYLSENYTGIIEEGMLIHIWGMQRDITERKRIQEEMFKAKERAEQSDRLKSIFLANMSHEIRTPMNAIVGFAEMLTDPTLSDEERTQFSQIVQSRSNDLMHIINDLLEISRIESGNATVVKNEVSVNDILNELESSFGQRLQRSPKSNLSLEVEKALPDSHAVIFTDAYILKQVFSNLIENAVKYTHSGSISFGYLLPGKDFITFFVRDTGIGISPANQAVIFEHFRQAEIENRHQYSGTGLGLAICKGSLTLLNGKIWVESEQGNGSTFYFTLPYDNRSAGIRHPAPDLRKQASGIQYSWAGKRLLVVEDEPTNLEFLTIILQRTEAEIMPVESGEDLRTHYHNLINFDLVLLDVRLPDANGWDLAREIKAIRSDIPVIAQTAYAMSTDLQKSMEAGCDNYISKPINKEKLLEMISNYLQPETLSK